ncbi:putative metalloprotease CJM1_0395 family protein [Halanaerobacter jeridensis]|uniref:SprA-related family protein n=1 Tax=Halanaerobacter jeridensis TaxID=706427 RepID=A0A938XR17_9FIRM|nr:putative metalloprotease CJM1_0395 family protein [Halanaerobacter jeridensis]MBM7555798.1 hypothetical protein [Halanaerobacter jeridensis]
MSINTVRSQPTPSWAKNINNNQAQKNNEQQKKTAKRQTTGKQRKEEQQSQNSTQRRQSISKEQPQSNKIANQETKTNNSDSKSKELDIKEQQQVQKLRQRDSEVRQHELAHKTTGGQYAGNITYTYQEGPDGRRYAVGGSVGMNISAEPGEPKKTIEKAEQVRKAALAPAQPSAQDLKVAAKAARMKMEAKAKLENPQANKQPGENNKNQNNKLNELYNNQQSQQEQQQNISLIA